MADGKNQLALITGASSGIGLALAHECAEHGYDLIIAADGADIHEAASALMTKGVGVTAVQADLATTAGVDRLYEAAKASGRPIDVLMANAGRGLGKGFLDQDFSEITRVIDTNITGTVYLLHRFVADMRSRGEGKVLITGSIAGLMPGAFQAVYNGTKAFIDSFAYALRNEVKDTGVTVTVLMPGATDTDFFETAGLLDTKVGAGKKSSAQDVAKAGFDAMMRGDGHEVEGFGNKFQAILSRVTPQDQLAEQHRKMAEPGSAKG